MTGVFDWEAAARDVTGLDTSTPHSARTWNWMLGGKENFPVDRLAAARLTAAYPPATHLPVVCRYFTARAVRWLADAGVAQFVEIGAGLPVVDPVHEVARQAAPKARVVYVDNDPLVLAHTEAMLCGQPDTVCVNGDLNDLAGLLDRVGRHVDTAEPVAVLLVGVLQHVPSRAAQAVAGQIREWLPAGGYLVAADAASTSGAFAAAVNVYNQAGGAPWHLHTPGLVSSLFDGLRVAAPGVVPVHRWRPEQDPFGSVQADAWGGVGRKT